MRVVDFAHPFMANYLAALVKRRHACRARIASPRDLSRQSHIKYAVLESGSIKNHVQASREADYERMWATMSEDPQSFVKTTVEGVDRVM